MPTSEFDRKNTCEAALIALRNWAERNDQLRIERASLFAIAWRAGEHDAARLAEAANVTTETVYDDLRSRDIDPHLDRAVDQ